MALKNSIRTFLIPLIVVCVFALFFSSCTYDKFEIPVVHVHVCEVVSKKITIGVSDYKFLPANVTATVGDTIEWIWESGGHTTTSKPDIPSGAVLWDAIISENNQTYKYILQVEGVYNYVCTPHAPGMSGVITVSKKDC